jgi:hypothetical protein
VAALSPCGICGRTVHSEPPAPQLTLELDGEPGRGSGFDHRLWGLAPAMRGDAPENTGARDFIARSARLTEFVAENKLACFACGTSSGPWAKTGSNKHGPWAICIPCVRKGKPKT